jgi:hypothetical protein
MEPNDQSNGGCSTFRSLLESMNWAIRFDPWERSQDLRLLDTDEARDKLKAVYLLAEAGAKWAPVDTREVNRVRRSLLKLKPEYTVEVVRIRVHFKACTRDHLQRLLRTQAMKSHVAEHAALLAKLLWCLL